MTTTDFCGIYVAMIAGLALAYWLVARLAIRLAECQNDVRGRQPEEDEDAEISAQASG